MNYYKLDKIDKGLVFENSWDYCHDKNNFDFLVYVSGNVICFNLYNYDNTNLISKILNKKYYWDR